MLTRRCHVDGEAAMRAFGARIGLAATPGTCILLSGPLGAGKTTLTQGIAAGLGVMGAVTSPTFTLVREHSGMPERPGLVHMDFYRLADAAEVVALGVTDYLAGADVVVIEWPERAPGLWRTDALAIRIDVAGGGRRLTLVANGPVSAAVLDALQIPDAVPAA
jgi:tRNA threonylcarbamoyladenosine biosynthesis protein TsaE